MPAPRETDNPLDSSKPQLFSQLMQDVNDVFVTGIKHLDSFPVDYQERLRNIYRFHGIRYGSNEDFMPKINRNTLDLV